MRLAILHYHLNRGGVTQVIANHLRALAATAAPAAEDRVAVLFGGRQSGWPTDLARVRSRLELSLHAVPELEYTARGPAQADDVARAIESTLRAGGLDAADSVVHIHNHALGKNVSMCGAVERLARRGWKLLLQLHDFAEDFRPDNYRLLAAGAGTDEPGHLAAHLYPQGEAIHYALLNRRDRRILARAGVPPERLHALPNPVLGATNLADRSAARVRAADVLHVPVGDQYVLYPVRGIRRKNLGELLLWAAATGPRVRFGLTLPPLNPVEQPRYRFWKELAGELELPVLFETGAADRLTYPENVAAADTILTTSVAEGFGMVFLECWLAGRPLLGRDLPEITADFRQQGVDLDDLADSIQVPVDWLGRQALVDELAELGRRILSAYGCTRVAHADVVAQTAALIEEGRLDFGRLPAQRQAAVIRLLAADPRRRRELLELNPCLRRLARLDGDTTRRVRHNAEVVRTQYGLEPSGRRLRQCYRTVLDSRPGGLYRLPNAATILAAFLDLSRIFPVRLEP